MERTLPDVEIAVTPASLARYYIDPDWYRQHQRSFYYALCERLCDASRDRALVEADIAASPVQAGRRRAGAAASAVTPELGLINEICECCSKTPEFRSARLSLGEILFRLLLAGGNRPTTSLELYEQVRSWIGPRDGRAISPAVVLRLLETAQYYGFTPAAP